MKAVLAVDSSAAVPLVARDHKSHDAVTRWLGDRTVALAGHALVETYSLLTRLPRAVRSEPGDVARVLGTRFARPLLLKPTTAQRLPEILAGLGVCGSAVYDALVALAAVENGCVLASRDGRARTTYELLGATVEYAGAG